jgi:hypothetical protein
MERRRLLQLGVASAIAAALPLPAIASVPAYVDYDLPLDKIYAVNDAFNIVEDYRFSLAEKANLLGFYPSETPTMADLRALTLEWVFDLGSRDAWDRVCFLRHIRTKLNERVGTDLEVHLVWMDVPTAVFPLASLRTQMKLPYYMDLYHIALAFGGEIDGVTSVFA